MSKHDDTDGTGLLAVGAIVTLVLLLSFLYVAQEGPGASGIPTPVPSTSPGNQGLRIAPTPSGTAIAPEALDLIQNSSALAVCHNDDGSWYLMPLAEGCGPDQNLGPTARWTRYFDRRTGNVVFVKTRCLLGEDSAAHLKLVQYDTIGRIVLGCYRHGY